MCRVYVIVIFVSSPIELKVWPCTRGETVRLLIDVTMWSLGLFVDSSCSMICVIELSIFQFLCLTGWLVECYKLHIYIGSVSYRVWIWC